jgi:hypothetical protein
VLSRAPVAKNAVARSSGRVIGSRRNQLPTPQMCERRMDGAFGESGCVGDRAHAGANVAPSISCGLTVKVEVNYKRRWLLIVPDQITHQHIQQIIVDRNEAFEARISK